MDKCTAEHEQSDKILFYSLLKPFTVYNKTVETYIAFQCVNAQCFLECKLNVHSSKGKVK